MPQSVYFSFSVANLETDIADAIRNYLFFEWPEVEFVVTYSTPIEEN